MKIWVSNKVFVVETKDNKLHILNWNALGYHLKHIMGLDLERRRDVKSDLENDGYCELNIERAS